ncbi:hypothetical protein IFO70_30320 [Phormidium tenue FACHB-886]|nr:hypothetical protein [Phormidium tenue FACHB-886]
MPTSINNLDANVLIKLSEPETTSIQGGELGDILKEPLRSVVEAGIATEQRALVAGIISTAANGGNVIIQVGAVG